MMLFQFFRHQIQRERSTIASTMRRSSENGYLDIGANMRLQAACDVSSSSPSPVVTVKGCYRCTAKTAQ